MATLNNGAGILKGRVTSRGQLNFADGVDDGWKDVRLSIESVVFFRGIKLIHPGWNSLLDDVKDGVSDVWCGKERKMRRKCIVSALQIK